MQERILGVAIQGAGWVAGAHAASWAKNPHVRIVSISDVERSRAESLAQRVGVQCTIRDRCDEALRDERVDVVDIVGPSHVHAEQAIAAAEAGKHLLVEKPMGLTLEENRALRDAVAKAGVRSLAGFVLRWNPAVETIRSLLAGGAIGDLFYAEVDYWHGMKPTHHAWHLLSRKKTGGSHAVDCLRWLVRDEVAEVTAFGNNHKGQFEYDANVAAIFKFRHGCLGKTAALFDCEMPYAFNMDMVGTAGTIRENRVWSKKLFPGQTGWSTIPTVLPDSGDVTHHPFDGEINHFVDCIRAGRESHCNVADAYRTHEVCLAIDRSLELGGRPVALPLE